MSPSSMPTGSQSQPRDHQQQQEENARFFSPGRRERTEANRRTLPAVWGRAASHDKPVHLAASMPSSVDNLERQLRDTKLDATAPSFMSTSAASRYTHATNVDQVPAPQVTYTPALYADYSIHAAVPAYAYMHEEHYAPSSSSDEQVPRHDEFYGQTFAAVYRPLQAATTYMPTFEELHASLTALIAQYKDLLDCYCQVGQQFHSIPMTLRTGPEASRGPGHFDAAFIFRPDDRLTFGRAENIVQGFGFCGQKIQTAFEFLQRGDLQTAAQGLYWKIPEYLDALSRVVESLESTISARVQAARMKEARLGRRRMTAQAWDHEMMKEREMAVEAAGQQAQWQTAVSDAERYVRGVEEQMRIEEAVQQEQRKKSLDMLMGRQDEIIRAFEEGTATQGDSVVAKGSAMPVVDAQGRERAVEVVQTAGPFVLDEEGRRKTGKAVYQLRKSIRKRERKEQEERVRMAAVGSAED